MINNSSFLDFKVYTSGLEGGKRRRQRTFKILLFFSFFCVVVWYRTNYRLTWSTVATDVKKGMHKEKYGYTKISIHNRDLSDLLNLFEPFNLGAVFRRRELKVLELGCGEGNTLLQILEANPTIDATCLNAPKQIYTLRADTAEHEASYGVLLESKGKSSWLAVCEEYNIDCVHGKFPTVRYGLVQDTEVKFGGAFDVIYSRGALYYVQDRAIWKYVVDKLESSLNLEGMAFLQVLYHIRKGIPKAKRKKIEVIASVYVSETSYVHLYWSPERYEPGIGGQFSSINLVLFKGKKVPFESRDPLRAVSVPTSCLSNKDNLRLEQMIKEVGTRKKGRNIAHGVSSYIQKSVPQCIVEK